MANRRRIMLAKITVRERGAKTYATWNPSDKSANVTLANGNLDCYAGAANFGGVRATVAMTSGRWYWELQQTVMPNIGFTSSPGLGVLDAASLVSGSMGFDTSPLVTQGGPRTRDNGNCYTGNVLTGTVGAPALNDVISLDYDADSGLLRARRNGGAWQSLGRRPALSGDAWFPMAQVARNARYRANFGASAFAYAVPEGANAGVYSIAASAPLVLYVGSEDFGTPDTGKDAATLFAGRLAGDHELETSREVSCWAWGGATRSSRGSLSLVAIDGELDGWLAYDWRDATVEIIQGFEGDAYADFETRSFESVESITMTDRRLNIVLADQLAQLDVAIPRPVYKVSNGNAYKVANPSTKVFGRPLYCEGAWRTTALTGIDAFAMDFSDDPVRIDGVFDRADPFLTIPADWAYTQDGRGVKLPNDPDEPVTAHPAGPWLFSGSDTITGANGGDFTSWSGSPSVPSGWTQLGAAWTVTNRFTAGFPSGARLQADGSQMVQMYNSGSSLAAGNYRLSFTVASVTTPGTVCFIVNGVNTYARIDRTGAFSVILRTNAGQLQFIGGHDGTNALGAIDVTITNLRARPLTLIEQLGDWTSHLCATLGGMAVDTAAVAALQTLAPYRLGHFADDDETLLSVMRRTMDGWCGWLVPKLDGTLTVGRVQEPAATASLELAEDRIRSVTVAMDVARGLSTRLAGKRNHRPHADSDIASSVTGAAREEARSEWLAVRVAQPSASLVGFAAGAGRGRTVGPDVSHADGAPPQPTLLQDGDDVQAEINRVCTLWRPSRRIYRVEAVLEAQDGDTLEPGQTVRVTWPRYGLDTGKNLLVTGVTTRFWSRTVTLTLWG